MTPRGKTFHGGLAAALGLIISVTALAQEPVPPPQPSSFTFPGSTPESFKVRTGYEISDINSDFAYDGPLIDFESLGLRSHARSISVTLSSRITRRGVIEGGFVTINREAHTNAPHEIDFLGSVIASGTPVDVTMKSRFYSLGYKYYAYDNGIVRLAGLAGLTAATIDTTINQRSASMTMRSPQLGAGVEWAVTPSVEAEMYFRGMRTNLSHFDGSMTSAALSATWFVWPSVGVGAGVNKVDIRLHEYKGADFTAQGLYNRFGALVFVEGAF
jgi:opacity protein-like surface antigen